MSDNLTGREERNIGEALGRIMGGVHEELAGVTLTEAIGIVAGLAEELEIVLEGLEHDTK